MVSQSVPYNSNIKRSEANNHKAQRFTALLGILSITMAFLGLTSAYLVRKFSGNWYNFEVPSVFYTSTLIILISSVTLFVAHKSNLKNNKLALRLGLFFTLVLGVIFCINQYQGWQVLTYEGIYLEGNPSGSFFYVITGMHAAHIVGGLVFLLIAFIRSLVVFKKKYTTTFTDEYKDKLVVRTDTLSIYWHFMSVLWVYLFVFLYFNQG